MERDIKRDMDEEMTNVDLRRLCRKEICNDSLGSYTTRIVGGEIGICWRLE